MSDTQRVLPPTAPPSYTESQFSPAPSVPTHQLAQAQTPSEAPPPYTPPTNPPYAEASSGYQRFEPVVVNQVEVLSIVRLGPDPCQVKCPSCQQQGLTNISYRAGVLTFLTAVLCFLFCIVCTFLPFCVSDLQDVAHYCPYCGYHIGTYTRM
ncbi:lipopolysaccharide-induced tumor necrosis factor-alpha factor homolog [Aplysia californica]|uniref:Lipopolysaccharide-induced tumor necrosis factor-alpha factor homolog n=1 Tax=Aplysia californica TaxID=6500 RepID=A0ABM1A596_APLCA|nr:lipopolysaccharide-induced tumor necrosis factor-alpha factor homolog [Aplysia californica]